MKETKETKQNKLTQKIQNNQNQVSKHKIIKKANRQNTINENKNKQTK